MLTLSRCAILGAIFACALAALFSSAAMIDRMQMYPSLPDTGLVVITGASSGIGRHAVESLARAHPNWTILAGVRKVRDAEMIVKVGLSNLQPLHIDVANAQSCENGAAEVLRLSSSKGVPLIGLVNNAGVLRHLPVENHPIEDAKNLFDVNVWGAMDLTQRLLPSLRQSHGRVVMISSIAGLMSIPRMGVYSASKYALEGLTDALRRELRPHAVSVSLVEPGYVNAEIQGKSARDTSALPGLADAMRAYPELYTPAVLAAQAKEIAMGDDPACTSEAIEDALVSSRPRARYAVANVAGIPASIATWLFWALPARAADALTGLARESL